MRGISEMKGNAKSKAIFLVFLSIFLLSVTYSGAQQFGLGVGTSSIQINQSQKEQLDLPRVDVVTNITGNVTISIPMSHSGSGLQNITMVRNTFGFKKPSNITINESGILKTVTIVGDSMTWEVNLSAGSAVLVFDVLPPTLSFENITRLNTTFFGKNFTISSDESLTNVSVTMEVNESYDFWTLFFLVNGTYEDKTVEFNLQVSNGTATFYGFHTSERQFSLEGSSSCTESWSCTDWSNSANSCGTRTCTDANSCGTEDDKPAETAACPSGAAGGGGGGGGGGAITVIVEKVTDFRLSATLIKEQLRGDAIAKRTIRIGNTGTTDLTLKIDFSGVSEFVITPRGVNEFEMELAPDEEKSFNIVIFGSELEEVGVYSGNILITGNGIEKKINVILEYETEEPIFDLEINVPERYSKVLPGDEIFAVIRLFNLRGVGKVDVEVKYSIKNSEGTTVTSGSTVIAVETQASFVRSLTLPSYTEPGNYVFAAKARFNGLIGTSSDTFEVVERPVFVLEKGVFAIPNILIFGTGALIILFGVLIGLSVLDMSQHHRLLGRKPEIKEFRKELRRQLRLLEESYEAGLISRRAYTKDKANIEGLLKRTKKKRSKKE